MEQELLSLILAAVIFTTSPLFAMDKELPEDKAHVCPLCKPEQQFKIADNVEEKGNFHRVPQEITISISENLYCFENLVSFSATSKAMYNLCYKPSLWKSIAQNYLLLALDPNLCIKVQFLSFLSLFSKEDKEYKVSKEQFEKFRETPCETTWWVMLEEIYPIKTYCFSIGKNQFELLVRDLEVALRNFKGNQTTFYPTKIEIYLSPGSRDFFEVHGFKDKEGGFGKVYVRKMN